MPIDHYSSSVIITIANIKSGLSTIVHRSLHKCYIDHLPYTPFIYGDYIFIQSIMTVCTSIIYIQHIIEACNIEAYYIQHIIEACNIEAYYIQHIIEACNIEAYYIQHIIEACNMEAYYIQHIIEAYYIQHIIEACNIELQLTLRSCICNTSHRRVLIYILTITN